jgi:hypothetical protein
MFDREHVDAILRGIAMVNTGWFPWSIILPPLFATVVILLLINCYRRPGPGSSRVLLGFLALVYIFSGFSILGGIEATGSTAWAGAIALWAVALLLIIDVILHQTDVRWPKETDLKYLSASLMVAGIFLYPLVELACGFSWPGMSSSVPSARRPSS